MKTTVAYTKQECRKKVLERLLIANSNPHIAEELYAQAAHWMVESFSGWRK